MVALRVVWKVLLKAAKMAVMTDKQKVAKRVAKRVVKKVAKKVVKMVA